MTQYLPPNLLALFAPRDPIPYLPPVDKLPHQKRTAGYSGIADFLNHLDNFRDEPPAVPTETREERRERRRREKAEQVAYKLEQDIALWRPKENTAATSNPYKTLFVARVNYYTSEAKLRREFEKYGKIKNIAIIHEKDSGKPRGYAFIEYDRERDMHSAYKHADGKKIDGRRVLVDVERGRTVAGWLPRRLGGGLGGTRRGGYDVNLKHSGREEQRSEYLNRERPERPERVRSRSRSRERRKRSRSRSRDRHRSDRHKPDRPRDRERPPRDHDANLGADLPEGMIDPKDIKQEPGLEVERESKRRRSKSRDRERRRRRSRSRERKRRDRGEDRDREGRREREHPPRDQEDRPAAVLPEEPPVVIKQEPPDEMEMNDQQNEGFGNGYQESYNYDNSSEYM